MRHPRRSLGRRFCWASITAVLATFGCAAAVAAPASAASTIACAGTTHATFTPGLTETAKESEVSVADRYTSCVNLENLLEDRTASINNAVTGELTCVDLLAPPAEAIMTIKWHVKGIETSSVWDASIVASNLPDGANLVELAGTITSGEFEGQTTNGTFTVPPGSLDACSEPGGLTSTNGVATLEILPL